MKSNCTLPIWVRLPVQEEDDSGNVVRRAFCPITGLSRSKMVRLSVPSRENGFKAPVLSISVEEDLADESAAQESPAPTKKKRKARFVRLIRLQGPSPVPNRLALLDYLDKVAADQASAAPDGFPEDDSRHIDKC